MSRISVDVNSARIPVLQVGYQGENEVTDVLFDISSWITEFGEGVAQLRVKRPGNSEDESYVLSLTITDGKAVWTVSETDTANKGNGKVQLSYMVGNIVKKAVIYPYKVGKSIVGADNPVDPFDSWIERSKAWAIGKTLDGDDVPETDETYQNNAKYYAEQADILGSAQVVLAAEKADAAAASEAAVNGVSTQLTTRMSAIETEQAVQDARMDTFTSLPEGSTSGNAELADIRVGADGTTYDTAGNAVRGQIGELKSDLVDLQNVTTSENLWNEKWESGLYAIESGEKVSNTGYIRSRDLIEIEPNHNYCFYLGKTMEGYLVWFDDNKNWISYKGVNETSGALSPNNARYVAINLGVTNYEYNVSLTYEQVYAYVPYKLKVDATEIVNTDKTEWGKIIKTFSIISDSYSSFDKWNPTGNDFYYPLYSETVKLVSDTWWYLLSRGLGWNLLINDSYSGATVCTHVRPSHTQDVAFVNRIKNSMGENRVTEPKPDVIFILGGQNDQQVQAEIGSPKYSDWTDEDLYKFTPAFCYMINYLKAWNPSARIINISNCDIDSAIISSMATVCEHYGIDNIVLHDIEKDNMHPTVNGMTSIYVQIREYLKST